MAEARPVSSTRWRAKMVIGDCLVAWETSRRLIMPDTVLVVCTHVRTRSSVSGFDLCMVLRMYCLKPFLGL